MGDWVRLAGWSVASALKSRRDPTVENVAFRHQLMVLQRQRGKPRLKDGDRLFWIWLRRVWHGGFRTLFLVQPGVPPNRIDLLNAIDGVAFGEAWGQREIALLMDEDSEVPIHFIGLDSLMENKETAGRPKDMEDLQYLRHKQRS